MLALSHNFWLIVCAAVFGIVSPAGYEGGPFGPIEQTIISESQAPAKLTRAFSWYNLTGFGGAALGALFAGSKISPSFMFGAYALGGLALFIIYAILPIASNLPNSKHANSSETNSLEREFADRVKLEKSKIAGKSKMGIFDALHLGKSRASVFKLSALQALDSFGGGFVAQSLIAYWFYQRFHAGPDFTGPVFFWSNILAAVSFTVAPYFAGRFGLLRTMVFTHLPCSIALGAVAFMPSAWAAACLLLARSLFSSMDIPVRQAYTMLLVEDEERAAAAGITNAARAAAQGVAPLFAGLVMSGGGIVLGLPFICAGLAKSIYDTGLYLVFKNVSLCSESPDPADRSDLSEISSDIAVSQSTTQVAAK